MALSTLIIIAVVVIAGLLAFKFTKSVIKSIFLAFSLLGIILGVIVALIAADAIDFNKNFQTRESLFVLEENGKILTGFSGIMGEGLTPSYLKAEEISSLHQNYDDLDVVLGDHYKLFIIKRNFFDTLETIESGDVSFGKQEFFDMVSSDNPLDSFIANQYPNLSDASIPKIKKDLLEQLEIEEESQFSGTLFAVSLGAAMKDSPVFLFAQYQKGNVIIYPETMLFKAMKRIPSSLLQKLVKGEDTKNVNNG